MIWMPIKNKKLILLQCFVMENIITMNPLIDSIDLFYKIGEKSNNDAENKIREDILVFLANPLPPEYAEHVKWQELYARFHECLRTNFCENYSRVLIRKMAGRAHNYDFVAIFYDANGGEIQQEKLEFKHNSKTLTKIPQILSLQDRFGLISVMSYAQYYYENYLDEYLATIECNLIKPTLAEYMTLVSGTDHTKFAMFGFMREAESTPSKKRCFEIVKESIRKYLELYSAQLNMAAFSAKLKESQLGKKFLLWNLKKFNVEMLSETDLNVTAIDRIKNKNTIVVLSATYEYHMLLRWRNHMGILNPAWQISLVRRHTVVNV
jgi:hypothetical protein